MKRPMKINVVVINAYIKNVSSPRLLWGSDFFSVTRSPAVMSIRVAWLHRALSRFKSCSHEKLLQLMFLRFQSLHWCTGNWKTKWWNLWLFTHAAFTDVICVRSLSSIEPCKYVWMETCSYFNETGLENVSLLKEKTATTNQAVIVILFFCFNAIARQRLWSVWVVPISCWFCLDNASSGFTHHEIGRIALKCQNMWIY